MNSGAFLERGANSSSPLFRFLFWVLAGMHSKRQAFQCSLGWGGGTRQAGECEGCLGDLGDPCSPSRPGAQVRPGFCSGSPVTWEGLTPFPQPHLHPLLHLGVTTISRSQMSAQCLLMSDTRLAHRTSYSLGESSVRQEYLSSSPCNLPPFAPPAHQV